MATTTRKKKAEAPAAENPVAGPITLNVENLAAFTGVEASEARLAKALELSRTAAERFFGFPLPATVSNVVAQGVNHLAAALILGNALSEVPSEEKIPLMARAFWMEANKSFREAGA